MLGLNAYLSELAIQEKTFSECMELAKSYVLTNNGTVIAGNKEGVAILELNKVIARTYLYMNKHYKVPMTQATINLMLQWNDLDPVDEWECIKNERIKKVQGNDNPFITTQCL